MALLALVALCLLPPSLSSPSSSPSASLPASASSFSSSHRRSASASGYPPRNETDSAQHDREEAIENRGEEEARSMQQQYADDAQQQQVEQQQKESHHALHPSRTHRGGVGSVDRNATVVTGDELRHPRDPKQQQKQQAEVRKHGEPPEPLAEQRSERRDEEADRAERAEDIAEHNTPPPAQPSVSVENNNGTVKGSRTPYGHTAQPTAGGDDSADESEQGSQKEVEGEEAEEEEEGEEGEGSDDASGFHPLHNATESRLNQTSPWHNADPQARTWSHQQQPRISPPTSNSTTTNSTASSATGYAPGQYNTSSPLSYPLPVPSVDHAQAKVDTQAKEDAQDAAPRADASDSGSDADDELGVSEGEEAEEDDTVAATSTGGLQQPGNAAERMQVNRADAVQAKVGGWGWAVLLLALLLGAGAVLLYVWLRRVQTQRSYEEVQQFDAYGDLVDDSEAEVDAVQVKVY